ncbi:sulfatase-like hydrolase/transferase [Pseudovibrio sp. SPO723]|uniref:sulfatase-like hydrolase/transferase n=1 Tax=Nesiotobacter zosterae TaxID=392721 RepID=UPI0029C11E7A|nr:sulfatase-like hydrolase/transferase [Pseudovibrio sp. SPO723]MDX5594214.1 sulfatase-like hydrolase/transferase [Pseudovibrio sp. SPO723]
MQKRPNILFITADQWRGDSVAYAGNPVVQTPNVDALAGEGRAFLRHYAAAAPCSPARAAMYTGLYQMNNRVVANGTPLDNRFDNFARAARRAGYTPTLFGYTDIAADPRTLDPNDPAGKTYEGVLPGFEVEQALIGDEAPWKAWLRRRGHAKEDVSQPYLLPKQEGRTIPNGPAVFSAEETQTAYLTERFMEWFDEQPAERPWFAHLSYIHPHPPFVAPAPYNDMYAPENVPGFKGTGRDDLVAASHPLVALMRRKMSASDFVPGTEGLVEDLGEEDLRRIKAVYYGLITEVDAQLGRLFDHLKTMGAWNNTVIVFTSDHGEMMGDHGMLGKGGFYDQSQHIPLIIKVPGMAPQAPCKAMTSAVDLFPTLLEMTGIEAKNALDGQSLMPLMAGETPVGWRDAALWEFDFRYMVEPGWLDTEGRRVTDYQLMVRRDERYLLAYSPSVPPVLFDLETDPDCTVNLFETPEGQEIAYPLLEAMMTARMRAADDSQSANNVLLK